MLRLLALLCSGHSFIVLEGTRFLCKIWSTHTFGHRYAVISFNIAQSALRCWALETVCSAKRISCLGFAAFTVSTTPGFLLLGGSVWGGIVDFGCGIRATSFLCRGVVANIRHIGGSNLVLARQAGVRRDRVLWREYLPMMRRASMVKWPRNWILRRISFPWIRCCLHAEQKTTSTR